MAEKKPRKPSAKAAAKKAEVKEDAPVKYKWDPFKFIYKDKAKGLRPDFNDLKNFDNFMAVVCLSGDRNLMPFAQAFNLKSFARLPKEIQCKAYNSINGYAVQGSFVGIKKNRKHASEEILEKIMWAFDCNLQWAVRYREDPRINLDEIEDEYDRFHGIFNPEKS